MYYNIGDYMHILVLIFNTVIHTFSFNVLHLCIKFFNNIAHTGIDFNIILLKHLIMPDKKLFNTNNQLLGQCAFYHLSIAMYTDLSLVICNILRLFVLGIISCFYSVNL